MSGLYRKPYVLLNVWFLFSVGSAKPQKAKKKNSRAKTKIAIARVDIVIKLDDKKFGLTSCFPLPKIDWRSGDLA